MITRSVGELVRGRALHTIDAADTVTEVCRRLREHHVGALAVLEGDALIGIISERDVIARVVALELDPQITPVRAVMTTDPQTVDGEESLADHFKRCSMATFGICPSWRMAESLG